MKIIITEVQITCIVLMGLITLFLAFFLPTKITAGGKAHNANKLLTFGTLLITIHFCIQYGIHKHLENVSEMRTIINLLFGIPISYFFSLSYLYLLRDGKIHRWEWYLGPIALTISLVIVLMNLKEILLPNEVTQSIYLMCIIYGTTLLYYRLLLIQSFIRVRNKTLKEMHPEHTLLIQRTKWSLLVLVIIAFGFPFMTFCTSLTMRAWYGILAISSSFFYIISFISYCLTDIAKDPMTEVYVEEAKNEQERNEEERNEEEEETTAKPIAELTEGMNAIVKRFIEKESYTLAGITQKDAAIEMGISCNKLRMWLRSTPHEKFNNWIMSLRIEKSKELLMKKPELSNDEIAELCGFCDRQYFQHQFSKKEGVSPTKWQKKQNTYLYSDAIERRSFSDTEKSDTEKSDTEK